MLAGGQGRAAQTKATAEIDRTSGFIDDEVTLTIRFPAACFFDGPSSAEYDSRNSSIVFFALDRFGRTSTPHRHDNEELPGSHLQSELKQLKYVLTPRSIGTIAVWPFEIRCGETLHRTPLRRFIVRPSDEVLFKPVALQAMDSRPAPPPRIPEAPPVLPGKMAVEAPAPVSIEKSDDSRGDQGVPEGTLWLMVAALAALGTLGGLLALFLRRREAPPATAPAPVPPLKKANPIIGGKYELQEQIGSGGMGVVLLARDVTLGRKVAVKKMRPEIRSSDKERPRFLSEARIIAKVKHPYIVPIHDILEESGELYLVFGYVDGRSLAEVLAQKGRMSLPECKDLLKYVCEAVDFAHQNKVLHRDLKPGNVMVDERGFAMVMDFGLAREAKHSLGRLTQMDFSGTPAYMAPDQHLGESGRAGDVYALGVMLYEMLSGELPFRGPDFLAQKERRAYKPLSQAAPGLPAGCDALIAAALDPDPKLRIANVAAFLEMVKAL